MNMVSNYVPAVTYHVNIYLLMLSGTEVLNLGSFTLLPQHVVRLILGNLSFRFLNE